MHNITTTEFSLKLEFKNQIHIKYMNKKNLKKKKLKTCNNYGVCIIERH